jgi:hypothetical protein
MKYAVLTGLACFLAAGCGGGAPAGNSNQPISGQSGESPSEDLRVDFPGGSFSMDGNGSVKVRAQGVNVDVDREDGVDVVAPGLESLKVSPKSGVQVKSQDVDVNVDSLRSIHVDSPPAKVRVDGTDVDVRVDQ